VANAKNPADKLNILVNLSREIEAATKVLGRSELGADDFLPLFTFVCAVSQLRNLHAECFFIETFMSESSRTSLQGYLFINLLGASKVLAELDKKEQRRRASIALLPEPHKANA